ncbi:hypothetical protein BUE80_DR005583 [Diplocarpon rosae]|nr:hypothetical protein BUE80_DR005583 [Diplocarpon rosae]
MACATTLDQRIIPRHGHSQSHYSEHLEEQALPLPARTEHAHFEDEVRIHREEERRGSPTYREETYFREERRPTSTTTKHTHLDIELPRRRRLHNQYHDHTTSVHIQPAGPQRRRYEGTQIDIAEREYRSRFQPSYREESRVGTTVDAPRFQPSTHHENVRVSGSTVDAPRFQPSYQEEVRVNGSTVDAPRFSASKPQSHVRFTEETVDFPRVPKAQHSHVEFTQETVDPPRNNSRKMGYYDEDGRPCQVIRITTSSATGQHRYLGVDLFTKQLHEESSFISHPSPSVVVQTMLGPVFKQYRVLDLQDGVVVAMTETGDVKQAIPVIDQSNLWSRLSEAFESGRGSVRVQVISDHGKELVVDMKTIHGSRL